ncbi:secreted RxLR effector protein 161-like [Bidens hawaiensis]|uniref:secreted RxLR effector protein 161-like n=1 Tax=Bidens hawaiensis TaxID=980011 RepID=UPI00404B3EA0
MEPDLKLSKEDENPKVDPTGYRKIIGSLRYLTHTRPDLSYLVGYASRFMQSPTQAHAQAVKYILRYLRGSLDFGITYSRGGNSMLHGYSDSSHAVDMDDGRSTSGTVALSSCEAEFIAATSAACQALWLRDLLSEMTGEK